MSRFEDLSMDLQERVKIQIAQDAALVVKQGGRLIDLLDRLYTHGVEKKGPAVDFRRDAIHGEVLLFLLAANNFTKRLNKESSPEAFYLSKAEMSDIRILRNIWEHHADYILSGDDSFSRLNPQNLAWIDAKFGLEKGRVFTVSSHPGVYSISEYVKLAKIIREAKDWFNLVF
jgi:hypothetical protein